MNNRIGQEGLENAFSDLVDMVSSDYSFTELERDTGYFSYLLSPKQANHLKKLCAQEGWEYPDNYAITIKSGFVKHLIKSRSGTDNLNYEEIKSILKAAFSPQSTISINRRYDEQAVVINSQKRITVQGNTYYSAAFFEVGQELINKTAYHMTFNKMEAIKGNSRR